MMDKSLFATLENRGGYMRTNEKNILNPYVKFNKHEGTQALQDTLVAESIQMRGIEFYYLEREFTDLDLLFGEDVNSRFEKAWKFAAWLNSFESYEGQQSFFSKFGHTQNDEIRISINPGLFKYQVNGKEPALGDLIYMPMDNSLFEITWVEPYSPFYQNGKNPIRVIVAQKFIYSGEKITPVVQEKPEIEDMYNGLDLAPLLNLDGMIDQKIDQFAENIAVQQKVKQYAEPFDPISTNSFGNFDSPFGKHEA
ncbi:gp14 neck protein [Aeromonas phage 31]|uniref:Neck protein n=3 Tax=Biquartavirus 44RR2 TaxID=115987 RepID=Q6U9F2_9CAUD|nr:head closure Hc2 [Aeromonas phage 44RR2.8t]YP_238877.1 head closure Hc2 [Aeromonas phage 31]APU00622.1 head completion, neck hetero-dimeric protein [Aeromonas phage 44RR2.8t.2]APU01042.1 head completion, neck hetero-dimeric protein [Aeromonas phage 31.2]APU01952.1 head completion, neck hetero-dimeric protein [Aeromonas phage L9-6]APU02204.1 head completion, neck hetero-dimeric protein [Aeromonas phage Riv-10]APU02450.1 head completion, neck hetero-dimeric protein [Aeromonas phage SW69-9]